MQQNISLRILPSEAADDALIKDHIAQALSQKRDAITGFHLTKYSIDARSKQVWINLTVKAFINEPYQHTVIKPIVLNDISKARNSAIIIGAGPAGLFAALRLIEQGIKPIILERGKDVRSRRRDIAVLNKEGIINPESNYCFGEGGAGTYSDGKLYTRSKKRGDINRILHLFVQFGADKKILYESHPHIGTNKLPGIITAMREKIIECGGEMLFGKKVVDFTITNDVLKTVQTADGSTFHADAVILATGHSARDIFQLLYDKKILIEAKPFALGVRIEHPQSLIDSIQYHSNGKQRLPGEITLLRPIYLPAAAYNLIHQVGEKSVFSFCMCPGGIVAPAATNTDEVVVNGWSPSKRNNPFANSGIVVPVEIKDAYNFLKIEKFDQGKIEIQKPLLLMYLQQVIEQNAFIAGGGKFVAPAQRMIDFCNNKLSPTLPDCSYLPGVHTVALKNILPDFIYSILRKGFLEFGKKMKGYFTNEAIIVATESRTSSPVRIPRDINNLHHCQVKNLFPCGEGAGYAGGIMSAAIDGEKVASGVARTLNRYVDT